MVTCGSERVKIERVEFEKKSSVNCHFFIDIFLYCNSLFALEFIDTEHRSFLKGHFCDLSLLLIRSGKVNSDRVEM